MSPIDTARFSALLALAGFTPAEIEQAVAALEAATAQVEDLVVVAWQVKLPGLRGGVRRRSAPAQRELVD